MKNEELYRVIKDRISSLENRVRRLEKPQRFGYGDSVNVYTTELKERGPNLYFTSKSDLYTSGVVKNAQWNGSGWDYLIDTGKELITIDGDFHYCTDYIIEKA